MSSTSYVTLHNFEPPSPKDLTAAIGGEVEVLDMIGQGGMGAVYRGFQPRFSRYVAVKVIPPYPKDRDQEFGERFRREAQAMAVLNHPNIVSLYGTGELPGGLRYLLMEYVDGHDLYTLLKTCDLSQEHIKSWVAQVCDALFFAHRRGMIHRDVKPSNVLVTQEGRVKVVDFGLVKMRGPAGTARHITQPRMSVGTPEYQAPEASQEGADVDHRADVYSMGVMLYEMLTGSLPRGAWRAPSDRTPGVDPAFDEIVIRAMQPDPNHRYQTMVQFGADVLKVGSFTLRLPDSAPDEEAAPGSRREVSPSWKGGVENMKETARIALVDRRPTNMAQWRNFWDRVAAEEESRMAKTTADDKTNVTETQK